ncbi:MAG: hypothetical protein LBS98_06450 [Coriobacteriales bacterium]|jgi:hypothetical protein|nr:hypothetical protein [Coriobacteriales bacterium]
MVYKYEPKVAEKVYVKDEALKTQITATDKPAAPKKEDDRPWQLKWATLTMMGAPDADNTPEEQEKADKALQRGFCRMGIILMKVWIALLVPSK